MILVAGKKIAGDILTQLQERIAELPQPPSLKIITCDPNFETKRYLAMKEATAKKLNISLTVLELLKESTTETIIDEIKRSLLAVAGVVIQLPLPEHIDTNRVLAAVPVTHDVDSFRYCEDDTLLLPPVVAVIDEISRRYEINWHDKQVVIFGSGRLVGMPAEIYARKQGGKVVVITEATKNVSGLTKQADIIILGVGKPNLLTTEMVKPGVVVFDAGASEVSGMLVGDASPDVAGEASLFTPVPGGIGPLTVALLFRNLLDLPIRQ